MRRTIWPDGRWAGLWSMKWRGSEPVCVDGLHDKCQQRDSRERALIAFDALEQQQPEGNDLPPHITCAAHSPRPASIEVVGRDRRECRGGQESPLRGMVPQLHLGPVLVAD